MRAKHLGYLLVTGLVCATFTTTSVRGQEEKLKQAMSFRPFQQGGNYDRPGGDDLSGLKLGDAASIGQVGFLVRDANDIILRRFVDTDGDKRLDTWAYYLRGVEVYRDVDTNKDTKPDRFYWLGPEGSRIGIDDDQDRSIESWAKISPQEATIELVEALKEKNVARMKALYLTEEELGSLKLSPELEKQVSERLSQATKDLETKVQAQELPSDASWLHFGAPYPGGIVNSEAVTIDVFDNVSALYESDGENRQLMVGSMVLVDKAWKLIDFPSMPGEENAPVVGGVFFQSGATAPTVVASAGSATGMDVETLNQYQAAEDEFREKYGTVEGKALADLHQKRAKALMAIAVDSKDNREDWTRQYADIVSAAYQSGEFPDGLKELESQISVMQKEGFDAALVAYTKYRILNAWYSRAAETAEDLEDLQDQWQERLNKFIDEYPKNELAAEALFELGKIDDYLGDIETAEKTYRRIVADFPDSDFAARARGAVVRLTSEGRVIPFTGETVNGQAFNLARLKGRMVLIHYWATWCEPCKAEFDEMKELYSRYQRDGFEIVSISLDENREDLMSYLGQNKDLPWIHLYAPGGLEGSPLSAQLGVIALPTMMLVDKDGTVLERGTTLQQVEREAKKLK